MPVSSVSLNKQLVMPMCFRVSTFNCMPCYPSFVPHYFSPLPNCSMHVTASVWYSALVINFAVVLSFEVVGAFSCGYTKKQTNKYKEICNFTINRDHSQKWELLFFFVLHSSLHYCVCDDLQYVRYIRLQCKTWISAVLARELLMLFFAWNVCQSVRSS